MGGRGNDFGSVMPPKLEKNTPSGRIIMIASQRVLDRVEDWRSQQRPIPNKSEAVRILVEQALGALDGETFVKNWVRDNIHNDPFMGDDIDDRVMCEINRCREDAIRQNIFVTHAAFDPRDLEDRIREAIDMTHDPELGFRD